MPRSAKQREFIQKLAESRMSGQWSSGLCSFSSHCSKCVLAAIFPCFQFGENYSLMNKLEIPTVMDTLNVRSGKGESYIHPKICGCISYGFCSILSLAGSSTLLVFGRWINYLANIGFCMNLCLHTSMRNDLRESENIHGNCFNDCCTVLWCYPCALTQEYKELRVALHMKSAQSDRVVNTKEPFLINSISFNPPLSDFFY